MERENAIPLVKGDKVVSSFVWGEGHDSVVISVTEKGYIYRLSIDMMGKYTVTRI